jgi:hypothetical protein
MDCHSYLQFELPSNVQSFSFVRILCEGSAYGHSARTALMPTPFTYIALHYIRILLAFHVAQTRPVHSGSGASLESLGKIY